MSKYADQIIGECNSCPITILAESRNVSEFIGSVHGIHQNMSCTVKRFGGLSIHGLSCGDREHGIKRRLQIGRDGDGYNL